MQIADSPEILARFSSGLELVDIVTAQIRRELGPVLPKEDMLSHGREGLLDAARKFESDRGIPFKKYANYRVRGAILDATRSTSGLPRRAYQKVKALRAAMNVAEGMAEDTSELLKMDHRPEAADDRLTDQLAAMATAVFVAVGIDTAFGEEGLVEVIDTRLQPDDQVERDEIYKLLKSEVQRLPETERRLVNRHFFQDVKLDIVAREMGMSKSWGSRVLARAMQRLYRRIGVAVS